MFTIVLYNNSSTDNKINKSLTNSKNLSGTLREGCSMLEPSVLIESVSVPGYNYCYIPEFERYYFITNIRNERNNLWRLDLTVDVLESFATDIYKSSGIIDKQENTANSNLYINDGSFVTQSKEFHDVIGFSNGFIDDGEYILITCGSKS